MHSKQRLIEQRLKRVLTERIRPAVHARTVPLRAGVWNVPGEPVPVADGLAARYRPVELGHRWGPPWSTSWFRITGRVPEEWAGRRVEAVVDLGFDVTGAGFSTEGLVHRTDGTVVKALNPRNGWIPIADPARGGEEFTYYIEAAANPALCDSHRPTPLGDPPPWTTGTGDAGDPLYRLLRLDLAVFDTQVWELAQDLDVLGELMLGLPEADPAAGSSSSPSTAPWTPSTSRTSPAARPPPARSSGRRSPPPPSRAPTASPPSDTPTSTPPGSGRCARPSARSPAPCPTSPTSWTTTRSSSSPCPRPSNWPG